MKDSTYLRDFFQSLRCEEHSEKIEKINMHPHSQDFFLCVDCIIKLAETNNKYKDYYIPVSDFVSNLSNGKYCLGTGLTDQLKTSHDQLKQLKSQFENRCEFEDTIIDQDLDNLEKLLIEQVQDFFKKSRGLIKQKMREENSDLRLIFYEAENSIKNELMGVIDQGAYFDMKKFMIRFEEIKNNQKDLQQFLRDYLAYEEGKQVNLNELACNNVKKFDYLFRPGYNVVDASFKPYILNIEKFTHSHRALDGDGSTILEGFCGQVISQLENKFNTLRHISSVEKQRPSVASRSASKKPINTSFSSTMPLKEKTNFFNNTMRSGAPIMKKASSPWQIDSLSFKNAAELSYDCAKFQSCDIKSLTLQFHHASMTSKTAENMFTLQSGVGNVTNLKLNLSSTKMSPNIAMILSKALTGVKGLTNQNLKLDRCFMDDETFEVIFESLHCHNLINLSLSLEKIKITKRVSSSLSNFFYSQKNIDEIDLSQNYANLCHNSLTEIFEPLSYYQLCSFSLSLRSCGFDNAAILTITTVQAMNLQVHNRLTLDLSKNLILDMEAKELGAGLKTFSGLKQLVLVLEGCELGDEGIIYLEDAVLSMDNLQNLKLNVVKNGLTDETLARIMNQLNLMPSLDHLEFNARKNAWVTDKQRELLSDTVCSMQNFVTKKTEFQEEFF